MTPKRFLRRNEVLSRTGLGATTIYKMEKSGEFPRHILITPRCAGWDESEVDAWMISRKKSPAVPAPFPDVFRRSYFHKMK